MAYSKRSGAYAGLGATQWAQLRKKFPPTDDVVQEVARLRAHFPLVQAFKVIGASVPENPGWDDLLDAVAHMREVADPAMRGVLSDARDGTKTASGVRSRGEVDRTDGHGRVVPLRAVAAGRGAASRGTDARGGARGGRRDAPGGGA